mgnify:CR=1 FL=1
MTRNQAIEIARQRALSTREDHGYLPVTEADAQKWMPHEWVIDAILWATTQCDLAAQQAEPSQTIYCAEKRKPGGCQLHNLHCGWPKCNESSQQAAQPQQAAPCDEEIGWLIEHRAAEHTLWWSGEFCSADGEYRSARLIAKMSNDANNAVRFARKEDAQRVLDAMLAARPSPILARAPELYSVTEHMWTAAAQPQQANAEDEKVINVRPSEWAALSPEARGVLRRLVFAARTAGGTAGHDQGLTEACDAAEALLLVDAEKAAQHQQSTGEKP